MSRLAPALKRTASFAIVACIGYFLWRAFRRNWSTIREQPLHPNYLFVALAFASVIVASLLAAWAWHLSVNYLSQDDTRITLGQSVATVTASGLTKYVPGKIWAYALQVYWLTNLGFSKSLVLYVNLVNLAISLICNVILGLGCWLVASSSFRELAGLALVSLLALDLACIWFSRPVLNATVRLLNKLFKRNLSYFRISPKMMLQLQAVHFLASFMSGFSIFLLSIGVGYSVDAKLGFLIAASTLISDVVGYLAFMVPGGIGVREGLMYAMLGGTSTGPIALVLPVATRVLSMLSEVTLGAISLKLLQGWSKPRPE